MTASLRDASVLVLVTRDGMGHAEQPLRHKLIRNYLGLLEGNGMLPGAVAFYGEGVRMVVEGSPVLDHLASLEARGVHLVVCKTCLDEYGLLDRVRVGVIGGMSDILAAQWKAAKVVTI